MYPLVKSCRTVQSLQSVVPSKDRLQLQHRSCLKGISNSQTQNLKSQTRVDALHQWFGEHPHIPYDTWTVTLFTPTWTEGTAHGDPLAMVFYVTATLPMIAKCKVPELLGEAWFADDATGVGRLTHLRTWWDRLNTEGPKYGYFLNGAKLWLMMKEKEFEAARIFQTANAQITTQGQRLLSAALGTATSQKTSSQQKLQHWNKNWIP